MAKFSNSNAKRMARSLRWGIVATFIACCVSLFAQQDAGSLRVSIQDQSGAAVPGGTVKVTNTATNTTTTQLSSGQGYAIFAPIPRGAYTVEVTQEGFRPVRVNDVTIDVNQNRLLEVTMTVAQATEVLEVTAQAATIQTEDASLGQVVQGSVISQLPLAGRRYTDLTLLAPGAAESTADPNIRGPGFLVVNGNSQIMNNFLLDGFDNNQNTQNLQSRSSQVVSPSPDTLSEFKVQTNSYSAEFGRAAGAVINASIKSGTNQLHGSAWWYNRDASLAANTWANNWANIAKNDLRWNQVGGTIGGPVIKDKLFFFGDYESFRSNVTNTAFVTVPTMAERSGDFSALTVPILDPLTNQPFQGNKIPQDRWDPLAKKVLDQVYPQPNFVWPTAGTGGRPLNNYTRSTPQTQDTRKFDIRMDHYATSKDRFFGRYSWNWDLGFKEPTMPGLADTGAQDGGRQFARNQAVGGAWNRIISNSMVNEARFGYNRTESDFSHATVGLTTGTEFGFKGIPQVLDRVGGLPRMTITGYQSIGTGNFRPQFHNPHSYQFTDALSIVKGTHTMKMGFDYRAKEDTWVDLAFRTVAYNFDQRFTNDGAADFLLGQVQSLGGSNFFVAEEVQTNYSAYFQDDWKLRRNLTLNLGVRYEYTTPKWGRAPFPNSNYDFIAKQLVIADPGPLVFGGRRGDGNYLQNPDRNNFAPRLGIAYQVRPSIVVRSGFGMFYNGEDITGTTAGELLVNVPNLYRVTLQRVGTGPAPLRLSDTIPANFLDTNAIASTNLALNSRWPDALAAAIYQWNTAVQVGVGKSSTFEVAYVGNHAKNIEANFTPSNTPWGVDGSVIANRRFQQFQTIGMRAPLATSGYHALQTKFERRFAAGWYNLTSYTFSYGRAQTSYFGSGGGGTQYLDFNAPIPTPIFENAFNDQIPRQRLSISNIYKLPFGRGEHFGKNMNRVTNFFLGGWQTQMILTARSGTAINVTLPTSGVDPTTGRSFNFFPQMGGGQIRPDRVGSPNTSIDPRTDRLRFLDINAFRLQAINTPGNAGRNVAWGPPLVNFDIGLTKRFMVTESKYFDFRLETFNTFNHVNFRNPLAVWGSAGFGQITDSYSPRQIQLALRFAF